MAPRSENCSSEGKNTATSDPSGENDCEIIGEDPGVELDGGEKEELEMNSGDEEP